MKDLLKSILFSLIPLVAMPLFIYFVAPAPFKVVLFYLSQELHGILIEAEEVQRLKNKCWEVISENSQLKEQLEAAEKRAIKAETKSEITELMFKKHKASEISFWGILGVSFLTIAAISGVVLYFNSANPEKLASILKAMNDSTQEILKSNKSIEQLTSQETTRLARSVENVQSEQQRVINIVSIIERLVRGER